MKTKLDLMQICLAGALLFPAVAQAQFSFTTNADNTITITGYTGASGIVAIPSVTNGYPVTTISSYAFWGNSTLTNLTIPASVTNIGTMVFQACSSLTNVTMAGDNPIYASAGGVLFDKELTTLLQCPGGLAGSYPIPAGVTSIANNAFEYCSQVSGVVIPNSVTSIGNWAFVNAGLTSVTVPLSVTNIGYSAFGGWSSVLSSITVDGANPVYASAGGVLFNKPLTTLLQSPPHLTGGYAIPDGVTNIADRAFIYSSLSDVTFPGSVLSIGNYSFYNDNNLIGVTIPDNVASIGSYAFDACYNLTSATLGGGVTTLGGGVFGDCAALSNITVAATNPNYASAGGVLFDKAMAVLILCPAGLASYTMPAGVTSIGDNAFYSCYNLTNVTIASSVAGIGQYAFYNCSSLTSVTIPDAVGDISYEAFGSCSALTNILFGSGVTNISESAFDSDSSLLDVTIPNGVASIGNYAFQWCSGLTNLVLGSGVASIGFQAFIDCSALTTVTIPGSVTLIGSYCFQDCSSLTQACFQGDAPLVDGWEAGQDDNSVFSGESGTVYYSAGTAGWDTTFGGWPTAQLINPAADFTYSTGNGTITITGYAGAGGSVVIPDTINGYPVTSIGAGAFLNVSAMTNVVFGSAVSSLGDHAFDSCSNLTSVIIPATITNLGAFAFANCLSLSQVLFQGNAPSVDGAPGSADNTVFAGETGTAFYLADATGWGAAFGGWPTVGPGNPASDFILVTNINTLTIVGYIGTNPIVVIPDTLNGYPVTEIAANAFYDNHNLASVSIPGSVTSIGDNPFVDCSSLTNFAVSDANPLYSSSGVALFDKARTTLLAFAAGGSGSYTIPGTVSNIGSSAFVQCYYLTNVVIPDSVISIGTGAFVNSGLVRLSLGNGVASLGDMAFYDCVSLTSVAVPNSVTSIGTEAFDSCLNLTNVVIGTGVTNIGSFAFAYCMNLHQAYFQGDAPTVDGGPVSLDGTVFYGETQLYSGGTGTAYVAPGTTGWGSTFGGWPVALWSTPATDFTFVTNNGAITIEDYIGTNGLVIIPNYINRYPVASIADFACNWNHKLTGVILGDNVTNLGWMAFSYCDSLTSFSANSANPAFAGAGGVLFNKNMTTLVLYPAGLAGNYIIPDTVTNIGVGAFATCSALTNVAFPNGLVSMGHDAFIFCDHLTRVALSSTLTSIGAVPFYSCGSLTNITVAGANPNYASLGGVLFDKALTLLIQYPAGLGGSYAMPDSVLNLGVGAFAWSSGLANVTLGKHLSSIPIGEFFYCDGLTNIIFPDSVTSIASQAFGYCSGLTSVIIGNGITNVDTFAFWNCDGLTNVTFGSHVTTIGDDAFIQCYKLASVNIPNNVTSIGDAAFNGCSDLTSVTIGSGVTNISTYAFIYCPNLHQVYFLGNAPAVNGAAGSADITLFYGETGTVFFASGTAGWGATFGGWPAAAGTYQASPQITGSGGDLGVRNHQFHFSIAWATNTAVVVEASTDLQEWTPVLTNALVNGAIDFSDPAWANYPRQYYRVRSQ